ncbi:MAG: hypothetical protein R3260_03505 [Pseudomonas sp.]|nr:hypothetical protein [Pseudomonas sp.]
MNLTESQLEAALRLRSSSDFQELMTALVDLRNTHLEFAMMSQKGDSHKLECANKAAALTEFERAIAGAADQLEKARSKH